MDSLLTSEVHSVATFFSPLESEPLSSSGIGQESPYQEPSTSSSSLPSQTLSDDCATKDELRGPDSRLSFEALEEMDKDFELFFSKEEMYVHSIFTFPRERIRRSYLLHPINPTSPTLENVTPYLYSEAERDNVPSRQVLNVKIIDKTRLQKRLEALELLKRPYHPLLYSSVGKNGF